MKRKTQRHVAHWASEHTMAATLPLLVSPRPSAKYLYIMLGIAVGSAPSEPTIQTRRASPPHPKSPPLQSGLTGETLSRARDDPGPASTTAPGHRAHPPRVGRAARPGRRLVLRREWSQEDTAEGETIGKLRT